MLTVTIRYCAEELKEPKSEAKRSVYFQVGLEKQ